MQVVDEKIKLLVMVTTCPAEIDAVDLPFDVQRRKSVHVIAGSIDITAQTNSLSSLNDLELALDWFLDSNAGVYISQACIISIFSFQETLFLVNNAVGVATFQLQIACKVTFKINRKNNGNSNCFKRLLTNKPNQITCLISI